MNLGKRNYDSVEIPPYSPSQGGSWESMVNVFEDAFNCFLDQSQRKPSLIEIQTFTSDAVRIVNDRSLTSLSDKSNDLSVITPSSFRGQGCAPNYGQLQFVKLQLICQISLIIVGIE